LVAWEAEYDEALILQNEPDESVRSEGEWCSTHLVLVVEALKTCPIADVSVALFPGVEEVVDLDTGG